MAMSFQGKFSVIETWKKTRIAMTKHSLNPGRDNPAVCTVPYWLRAKVNKGTNCQITYFTKFQT